MEKEGPVEFDVSAEEFKASGWHIPRAQLVKKNSIGKGEYGGTFVVLSDVEKREKCSSGKYFL